MLEITKSQIRALNDTQLRELVGRLCESELCRHGVPISSVSWGGAQTAVDGGTDVRISSTQAFSADYVCRPNTVFQVKYPDLAPAEITKEMCPKGNLRPIISNLNSHNGAYIIISSGTDASDKVLQNRKDRMKGIASEHGLNDLTVDYYDLQKITSWVNQYLPVAIWVRDQIGEPIVGWKIYGNWSNSHSESIETYLLDDKARLKYRNQDFDVARGIELIREQLSQTRSSIRLVGLSGVGKTKLVQTLFDDTIANSPLSKEIVVYTDISDSPEPSPTAFCERIYARNQRIIVVVDNCSPAIHESLTRICSQKGSLISLITIEYDIKEDQPENTEVYQLDMLSEELIVNLLRQRFPYLDQAAREKIAHISGGNARIAIAITNQIKNDSNIPAMNDRIIFEKLFWQRGKKDAQLLRASEVMALVYSFSIEGNDKYENELQVLAEIVEIPYALMYRYLIELNNRDLVQARSRWRALLPHAIANRLATDALAYIPNDRILSLFTKSEHPRLLASFCHRLSYMHMDANAVSIISLWISPNGWLHNVYEYGSYETKILTQVAATAPQQVLDLLKSAIGPDPERFTKSYHLEQERFYSLIHTLAYDKNLFKDSTTLLVQCVLADPNKKHSKIADTYLLPLFRLYASETEAQANDKLDIIGDLIASCEEEKQSLGYNLLAKSLDTRSHAFIVKHNFGSHLRGYGYCPDSKERYIDWYSSFLEYALTQVENNSESAPRFFDKVLSSSFGGLWYDSLLRETTMNYMADFRQFAFFPKLLAQVDQTARHYEQYTDERVTDADLEKLNKLREVLYPRDIFETFIAATSLWNHSLYKLGILPNDYSEAIKSLETMGTRLIEKQAFTPESILQCCTAENTNFSFFLGKGVAIANEHLSETWVAISTCVVNMSKKNLRIGFISGFANQVFALNRELYREIIEFFTKDDELKHYYPSLISSLSDNPFEMLMSSFDVEGIDALDYWSITNTIDLQQWTEEQLKAFFCALLKKDDGDKVCVDIYCRIYNEPLQKGNLTFEQAELASLLLDGFNYTDRKLNIDIDYDLSQIAKNCFREQAQHEKLMGLTRKISQLIKDTPYTIFHESQLLDELAILDPASFINCFLADQNSSSISYGIRTSFRGFRSGSVLDHIDKNDILNWCELEDTENRLQIVAQLITPFRETAESISWTDLALAILEKTSNKKTVFEYYLHSFTPFGGFTPPLSAIYERKVPLFEELAHNGNPEISTQAKEIFNSFKNHIEEMKAREQMEEKEEERFE